MIYLSTGGFSDKTFVQAASLFDPELVRGLELSAGLYTENLESELEAIGHTFEVTLHNYFPAPRIPFVFNLASCDPDIHKQSMDHAKYAIDLTKRISGKYFSFHAGYLIDPDVSELGKKIGKKKINNRADGLSQFLYSIKDLSKYAAERDVMLLIENNVLSAANFKSFDCNPLQMTEPAETARIFSEVDQNVKLLVDVAHLKVSARTLGFDPVRYLDEFAPITRAYHISDNNGLEDSNEPFRADSWFLPHIRKDLDYYSLEIYSKEVQVLEEQYTLFAKTVEM